MRACVTVAFLISNGPSNLLFDYFAFNDFSTETVQMNSVFLTVAYSVLKPKSMGSYTS